MPQRDLQQTTKSGLQKITKGMLKILDPFTKREYREKRKAYLDSLGISETDFKEAKTEKLTAFEQKKAEEADTLAFLQAVEELSTIITNIEDLIQSIRNESGEQAASDALTVLLNLLTVDFVEREFPTFHNIILILYSLNAISNKGGGSVAISDLIEEYWDKFWNIHFKNPDEARNFSEVLFLILTVLAYVLNSQARKREKDDLLFQIGGQFGYAAARKTQLDTPQDLMNDILSRAFAFSFRQLDPSKPEAQQGLLGLNFTFIPLSDAEVDSGLMLVIEGEGSPFKSLQLSENWFVSVEALANMAVRLFSETDEDLELDENTAHAKALLAFEYLPLPKDITPQRVDIPTLFDVFRFGFGNLSLQLETNARDVTIRTVIQTIYAIEKGTKKGFPYKFLPEKRDFFQLPLRYSLKNRFGMDGGFVGERPPTPPDTRALILTRDAAPPSVPIGDLTIPIHRELGFVRFDNLYLGFEVDKSFKLRAQLDFALKFTSAVTISISKLGTSFAVKKRTQPPLKGGFFGYDILPEFLFPKGAGIVIDAKVVKGGGFLYFDDKKGEYFGAIELRVKNKWGLNAIGIIRTKNDAGQEHFSFLVLITAELLTLPLGFGFKLIGGGGIVALNRRANVAFIQEGLTKGVLQDILFPKDVVANMNRIIGNLNNAFPVTESGFLIGIMAKIGWGAPDPLSPPNIIAEIGLIVEFGEARVLIPGIIRAFFPNQKRPVVKINVSFLGILDFKNEFAYLRAELFVSRLLSFKLTGSLVFGISWGTPSVFVLSAGGFHPAFTEIPTLPTLPNAFNNLQRLSIQLLDEDNPRITVEIYFAVTSNTVQIGGKAELYYYIAYGYNVYGRLEVNALFHFNPFHFIFDLAAEIALRDGEDWVMGIGVYGSLEGPEPWHLKARAKIKTPWYLPDIDVGLDEEWGNKAPTVSQQTAEVRRLMREAISDARNWQGILQEGNNQHVKHKKIEPIPNQAEKIQVAPNGILQFSQTIAPLNLTLQKFGEQKPDIAVLNIKSVKIGAMDLEKDPVQDLFAADMFFTLTDDERLSRPSFERMTSGFKAKNNHQMQVGAAESIDVTGEISKISSIDMDAQMVDFKGNMFDKIVKNSSMTYKSEASHDNQAKQGQNLYRHLAPTWDNQYIIASKEDMKNGLGTRTFNSFSDAQEALQKMPLAQRQKLQVVDRLEWV
jgi:hypothetical protein